MSRFIKCNMIWAALTLCGLVAAVPSVAATQRTFRVIMQGDIGADIFCDINAVQVNIRPSSVRLSNALPVPGSGRLELYRMIATETPSGIETSRQVVASSRLPAGESDLILLLLRTTDQGEPLLSVAIGEDPVAERRAGVVRVFNESAKDIAVKVGDDILNISAGGDGKAEYSPSSETVPLVLAEKDGEGWRLLSQGNIPVRHDVRLLVFVFNNESSQGDGNVSDLNVSYVYDPVRQRRGKNSAIAMQRK